MSEMFDKMMETAQDLWDGTDKNPEYLRGMAELITNSAGLGLDKEYVIEQITKEPPEMLYVLVTMNMSGPSKDDECSSLGFEWVNSKIYDLKEALGWFADVLGICARKNPSPTWVKLFEVEIPSSLTYDREKADNYLDAQAIEQLEGGTPLIEKWVIPNRNN